MGVWMIVELRVWSASSRRGLRSGMAGNKDLVVVITVIVMFVFRVSSLSEGKSGTLMIFRVTLLCLQVNLLRP
jgi:hypothetical protein